MEDKRLILLHQHGVTIPAPVSDEYTTDCIFCGKESHLHFTLSEDSNGIGDILWSCHRCGLNGNKFQFIQSLVNTNSPDLRKEYQSEDSGLCYYEKLKGLPPGSLIEFGAYINPITNQLCIPIYNPKGQLANIYIYDESTNMLGSSAILKRHVYGSHLVPYDCQNIWIVEGHWDFFCMYYIIETLGLAYDAVIALPGASSFKPENMSLLRNRNVNIVLDNDHPKVLKNTTIQPGKDGTNKILKIAKTSTIKTKTIRTVNWHEDLEDGYDIKDLCRDFDYIANQQASQSVYDYLQENLQEPSTHHATKSPPTRKASKPLYINSTEKDSDIETFDDLCNVFDQHLQFSDAFRDTLIATIATVLSPRLPDQSICMYVVGPPSSGKSTLCESFADVETTKHLTKFTGLVSGYETDDGEDNSVLNQLFGKCLFIKDFTTVLSMPPLIKDGIFGDLRDATDGAFRANFRNNIERVYENLNFSVVAGVTDEIRSVNNSNLGARFLAIEIVDEYQMDSRAQSLTAISNLSNSIGTTNIDQHDAKDSRRIQDKLKPHVTHFVDSLADSDLIPKRIPRSTESLIVSCAEYVAHMRAKVKRTREGYMEFPARHESPARVSVQLAKQYIMQTTFISDEKTIIRVIKRLALDTICRLSYRSKVLWCIHNKTRTPTKGKPIGTENRLVGVTSNDIVSFTKISKSTVERIIKDFKELHILQPNGGRPADGVRGRFSHEVVLTDKMRKICNAIDSIK